MKLKTLKDIKEEFRNDCVAKDYTESVMINKLRQEAIKHFKDLRKRFNKAKAKVKIFENEKVWIIEQVDLNDNYQVECIKTANQMEWIKKFFNLTDKDLETSDEEMDFEDELENIERKQIAEFIAEAEQED